MSNIQVFVKHHDGKTSTFEVKGDDKVSKVKDMIYEDRGIPADKTYLVHNGKKLLDENTLEDSGVKDMGTIFSMLRLLGGQ